MGDTFKENSVNNINRKKYESNYEKIFGKKEKKMLDPSDNPASQGARSCFIHTDVSFAIDDDCPVCIDQEDCEIAGPYIDRIEVLNREILRLKKQLSEVAYTEREI